jgi:uncharacterized repeat protein (TIGR03803 family)
MMCRRYAFLLVFFAACVDAQIIGDLNCIEDAAKCPDSLMFTYLFSSATGGNGFSPAAAMTLGNDGNFYGTTKYGGAVSFNSGRGYGTVFRMAPGGGITTLYAFTNNKDGALPDSPLVKGPDGTLWGITSYPASVFKIATDGTFTSFGLMPYWAGEADNGLCLGADGNLYGTMIYLSAGAPDTFFRFTPDGVATQLYTFKFHPGPVVAGQDGYFYGTNSAGLYRLSPFGDYTVIGSSLGNSQFPTNPALLAASDGYLYGFSSYPQTMIVKMDTSGSTSSLANLSNSYLSGVVTALVEGSDGNLYGTTNAAVYSVSPYGQFNTLYPLQSNSNQTLIQGASNVAGLTFGPGGLYGVFMNGGPGCQNAGAACSPYTSGAVFQLSAAAAGASQGTGGPPPALKSTLDAVDPNNDTLRPFLALPSLGIEWDNSFYQPFASYTNTTSALAADGVTPLVIRWHFSSQPSNSITFTLADAACASTGPQTCENTGGFSCLDLFNCFTDPNNPLSVSVFAQPLPDGTSIAMAVLQAPLDFVRPSQQSSDTAVRTRAITLTATTTATTGDASGAPYVQTLPLTVWRPPVALLHGIWSSSCTWNKLGLKHDTQSRFVVYAEDYEPANSYHFAVNAHEPQRAIANALAMMHANNVAATQVDFIGHSMGGLLARLYAGGAFVQAPYVRPENLGYGDIHKLITLDTPHLGSELANALIDSGNNETNIGTTFENAIQLYTQLATQGPPCNPANPPSSLLPLMCITCGAVQDLRPGSAAISGMPVVNVPSHVIVGRGGVAALADTVDFSAAMAPLGGAAPALAAAIAGSGFQYTYFGTDSHDLIVSATSQQGNMFIPDQISYLDAADLQDWAVHTSVTSESQTNTVLVNLLNAPLTNSDIFGGLPSTP